MGYVSTGMGDRLSALLVSLMALWLALVDRQPLSALFLSLTPVSLAGLYGIHVVCSILLYYLLMNQNTIFGYKTLTTQICPQLSISYWSPTIGYILHY